MAGDGKVSGLWGGSCLMAGDGMDILQGYWKGWKFLYGFLNVGFFFEWVLAGGEF